MEQDLEPGRQRGAGKEIEVAGGDATRRKQEVLGFAGGLEEARYGLGVVGEPRQPAG